MELQEFISKTIEEVLRGTERTHDLAREKHAMVGSHLQTHIEFDVAVTVTKESKREGGLGISIVGIGASAGADSRIESSTISRVKFVVPIRLPQMSMMKPSVPFQDAG